MGLLRFSPHAAQLLLAKQNQCHLYDVLVVINDQEEALLQNIRHDDILLYRHPVFDDLNPPESWRMNSASQPLEKRSEVQFLDLFHILDVQRQGEGEGQGEGEYGAEAERGFRDKISQGWGGKGKGTGKGKATGTMGTTVFLIGTIVSVKPFRKRSNFSESFLTDGRLCLKHKVKTVLRRNVMSQKACRTFANSPKQLPHTQRRWEVE